MANINYGIKITFNRKVPDAFNAGSSTFVNQWALTTQTLGSYVYDTTVYTSGYISKDSMSPISKRIDISQGGKYAYDDTSFNFSIRNGGSDIDNYDIFSNDIINAYQINPKGARVLVTCFINGVYRELWSGYINDLSVDDSRVEFGCKTDNKIIHRTILDEQFNDRKFPFIQDNFIGKTMPECIGWVPRAKLFPIKNKRIPVKNIWTNINELDFYYGDEHREKPTSITPIKAISQDGSTVFVFRGRTGESLSQWFDKTGKNLDIIMGGGKGESRKIIRNKVIQINQKVPIYYNGVSNKILESSDNELEFEYEVFELELPYKFDDVVPLDNYPILNPERIKRLLNDGKNGIALLNSHKFTEFGVNKNSHDEFTLSKSDEFGDQTETDHLAGFEPLWNRQYEVPSFGKLRLETSPSESGSDTIRFASNDAIVEYMNLVNSKQVIEPTGAGNPFNGNALPTGGTYMTIPHNASYVMVGEHKSDLVVSTSSIDDVAYGPNSIIYHDESFGEIPMKDLVIEKRVLRKDVEYPGIIISKDAVDEKPDEMTLQEFITPSKVCVTPSLFYKADKGGRKFVNIGSILPNASNRNIYENTKLFSFNGASNDVYSVDSIFTAEFDVYLDDIDRLRSFDSLKLGARLRISPNESINIVEGEPPGLNIAKTSHLRSSRVQVYMIDKNDNVLRNEKGFNVYNYNSLKANGVYVDQGNSLTNVTIQTDEYGDRTGVIRFEGLPNSFYKDVLNGEIIQDKSCSTGDITSYIKEESVSDIIKCFRIRFDVHLVSVNNSSVANGPNGWSVHLDSIGFSGQKKMDSSRIVTNCKGMTNKLSGLVDFNPAPANLLRVILRQIDGMGLDMYDTYSFINWTDYFPNVNYGKQVLNNVESYTLCNEICENSMLGMWTNFDGKLQTKFWLSDSIDEIEPTIVHDETKIINGSVNIDPNVYSSVFTEYEFKYGYDNVLGYYRETMLIRNTDDDEFPKDNVHEEANKILDGNGLPYYINSATVNALQAGNVNSVITINMNTLKNLSLDEINEFGFKEDGNIVIKINNTTVVNVVISNIRKFNNTFYIQCIQTQATHTFSISTSNFTVNATSEEPIWTRYCNMKNDNGELDYGLSKQLWEQVHSTYLATGIKSKAPENLTVLNWVHEPKDFNLYLDRFLYWTGFSKSIPSYSLPLNVENIDNSELLNWVKWVDKVHTNYVKYDIDDMGNLTGLASMITHRNGWITDYKIDPKLDIIEIKLILDKEKTEPLIIDENEDVIDKDTYIEYGYSGDDIVSEII